MNKYNSLLIKRSHCGNEHNSDMKVYVENRGNTDDAAEILTYLVLHVKVEGRKKSWIYSIFWRNLSD